MKILLTSDLHFHNYKSLKNNVSAENIFDVFNQMLCYCEKNEIKSIFILGDLFHVRGKLPTVTFNSVYKFLKNINKAIDIYILSGNHDQVYDDDTENSSIYALEEIENVHVCDWKTYKIGGCQLICAPYIRDSSKLLSFIETVVDGTRPNILLTHGTITGSKLANSIEMEGISPKEIPDSISKMFIGHIHHPQYLENKKIVVTGAPLCHDKGDMNSERGFWSLDCNTLDVEFISTEYAQFRSFYAETEEEVHSFLKQVKPVDFTYVTLNYSMKKDLTRLVDEYKQYNIEFILEAKSFEKENRLNVSIEDSFDKIMNTYIEKFGTDIDVGLTKQLSQEILQQVKETAN